MKQTLESTAFDARKEAFRKLRTNLLHAMGEERHKSIVITTADTEENTASVALELARSFVQNNAKTLLVDGNLRSAALSYLMQQEEAVGLVDVLQDKTAFEKALVREGALDVLPAGQSIQANAEAVYSDRLENFLAEWVKEYEIVLFDTPSSAIFGDAAKLSGMADGTLLVVTEKVSHKAKIREAVESIENAGGHITGVILNQVE